MAHTNNKHAPKVRHDAAQLVLNKGLGVRTVARQYGVSPGTISKWVQKAKKIGLHPIPTLSSKPKHHPHQLSEDLVWKIFQQRIKTKRCSEVVHQELLYQGIKTSLSSVKQTLDRNGLLKKKSLWKRYHPPVERPYPLKPGDLVEMDTIHLMISKKKRIYVFTLMDVYSRWIYAKSYQNMSSAICLKFVREAQKQSQFNFNMLQSDHGPEFGKWFVTQIKKNQRYTRIGKPNDNAHIERVNRTLQEECLDHTKRNPRIINCALKKYLRYYNCERLHLGINLKTPHQLLTECFQAIG